MGHVDEALQTLSRAYESYQDETDGQEPFDYQSPQFSNEYQVYAEFSNLLANMLISSGDGWQAINVLENLVNANPDVAAPRLRLVREMLDTDRNSEELQNAFEILNPIFDDSFASESELSEARMLMAEVYEQLGDLLLAVDTYKEELIPSTSENPEVQKRLILGLNRVALGLEQPEISRDAVLDAIQNAPDDPEFHIALYKN